MDRCTDCHQEKTVCGGRCLDFVRIVAGQLDYIHASPQCDRVWRRNAGDRLLAEMARAGL